MDLYLGLDVGTQGTKGLLLADNGEIRARGRASYGLIEGLAAGAAEQDPQTWVDAVADVARQLLATDGVSPSQVRGIGVSGQQHGLVALDADRRPVRPAKLWCDTSTAAEARELSELFGHPVPTGFTASKILWLRRHEPERWALVRHVLLPHDYLNMRLSGELFMEAGDASGTGLFDPESRDFRTSDVVALDPALPDMLPPLRPPHRPGGMLCAEGAELLGLSPGIPIAVGGGDNMMSAIGSGATEAGVWVLSLGTSGTVFTRGDTPVLDARGWIAPFCSSDGAWLPLLCVMNLTGVTEEVIAGFGQTHDALTSAAAQVPPGCHGLRWLPYLLGERVPDLPDATGSLLGMRPGSLRPGVLFRAAMEGTSLNLALGFDHMRSLGLGCQELRVVGGAAANSLWLQILADCLGSRIRCLAEAESGALGAALQAMWVTRSEDGEATSLTELTRRCVRLRDETVEPGENRNTYQDLVGEFRELLSRHYGVS